MSLNVHNEKKSAHYKITVKTSSKKPRIILRHAAITNKILWRETKIVSNGDKEVWKWCLLKKVLTFIFEG